MVIDKYRSYLSSETVEALICAKDQLKGYLFDNKMMKVTYFLLVACLVTPVYITLDVSVSHGGNLVQGRDKSGVELVYSLPRYCHFQNGSEFSEFDACMHTNKLLSLQRQLGSQQVIVIIVSRGCNLFAPTKLSLACFIHI